MSAPRRLLALVATAAAAGALVLIGPSPAQAHAELLHTTPADKGSMPTAPAEVTLTFDEPPIALGTRVQVTGPAGIVSTGTPQIVGATVHQALLPDLPAGAYRVIWRVTSDDGHPVSDTFGFTVTAGAATSSAPPSSATPSASPTTTPTTAPTAAPAGTDPTSQSLQSSGVSAPVLWGIAAAVLIILVGVLVALRSRRSNKENS